MTAISKYTSYLIALYLVSIFVARGNLDGNTYIPTEKKSITPLPIVSYDTDVGLGLGAKCFFLNQLGLSESFDVIAFGSTLGERWGRFVFSYPDFELRQGKTYPLSIDFIADYDVYLKNKFYGIGPDSKIKDLEKYRREPLDISLVFGRGLTKYSVVQAGLRYANIRNQKFEPYGSLLYLPPTINQGTAYYFSIHANARYDTRDSYIDPSDGNVLQLDGEYVPDIGLSNVVFGKFGLQYLGFVKLFEPKYVLAGRLWYQTIVGGGLPVQVLLSQGGNKTLRGYPQDRFLGASSLVGNMEFRFPIIWRFSGIAGIDAGAISSSNFAIGKRVAIDFVGGLRFAFNTFIVRLDVGFSSEYTGLYLNFGHVF